QQGEGSVNRVYGGLGLGLAIVRHITELHEGSVEAHSDGPNRGATFVVCLPRLLEVENAFARPSALPVSGEKLEGLNVLVVDDENDTRELVQMLLERHGAFVISAASVDEALSALNARVPDVIVSDIGMPHEDGNVLLQKVRALPNEQGGKVPALALTAFAGLADRTRALSSGFNMYVTKPVNPSELVLSVASLAGRLHRA
ncbi:MAG TPA: response regulator, partial [Polyangiaceae bacterium]